MESKSNKGASEAALATTAGATTGRTRKHVRGIPKWRTVKDGATKTVDGSQFWWCPHHKHKDNLWDGLFVLHPPEKHDEIMAKYANKRKATEDGKEEKKTPANANATLDLQENMKNVLMSNLCMSADDVDALLSKASEN